MAVIELTQGQVCVIDDEDLALVSQWKWRAARNKKTWYAARNVYKVRPGGTPLNTTLYMHRFLLNPESCLEVDHRDGNGLNNRRSNLRAATKTQNRANRGKVRPVTSTYKGVCRERRYANRPKKWSAYISVDGKVKTIGRFATEEEAARAYDRRAVQQWGEFASLNFPQEGAVQNDGSREEGARRCVPEVQEGVH